MKKRKSKKRPIRRRLSKSRKATRRVKRAKRAKKKPAPRTVRASKRGDRYALNTDFEFHQELRTLILKSSPAEKDKMVRRILGMGRVKLAVISGIFLNDTNTADTFNSVADLVIVGDEINRDKLRLFLRALEAEVGAEIKFTLMDKEEFSYRHGMFDRFVRVLLEGPHEKIINRLGI